MSQFFLIKPNARYKTKSQSVVKHVQFRFAFCSMFIHFFPWDKRTPLKKGKGGKAQ